jgi:integrase
MSEKKMVKNVREEKKTVLKPKTINHSLSTLRLMLGEAVRQKLIKENPSLAVKELKEEYIDREILTTEEVCCLFPVERRTVWKKSVHYKANLLAACTGMRLGEIRGLKGEFVFDEYIYVCGQYTRHGYKNYTKTKENRNVPIAPMMRQELEELIQANGDGYIFSTDGGETPLSEDSVRWQFERALRKIGIDEEQGAKRNLTFHAWRHFLNTLLRTNNIADSKVQSVTGHKTKKMMDHYTHFDTRQFTEVREAQSNLLALNKPESMETKIITDAEVVKVETEKPKIMRAKTVKSPGKKSQVRKTTAKGKAKK